MRALTIPFIAATSISALAQAANTSGIIEGKEYVLTSDVILKECSISGELITGGSKLCPYGAKFTVVGKSKEADSFILTFFDWYTRDELLNNRTAKGDSLVTEVAEKAKRYNYRLDKHADEEADRYFQITRDQLSTYARELHAWASATYGAVLMPLRYRPQTGVITKDLSLGGMGGPKFALTGDLSVSLLLGVAITSNTVDSASTEGYLTRAVERGSATLPIGLLVQWDKVQFGFMAGWDWMLNGNNDHWRYNGKPWLSLGIGLALFSEDAAFKASSKSNK